MESAHATTATAIIREIVQQLINQNKLVSAEVDLLVEREIVTKLGPLAIAMGDELLGVIEQAIFNSDLQTPFKYPVLMYASLLTVGSDRSSTLFSFYYKLSSHALKQLKQGSVKQEGFWVPFFQKLYHYGMLLLIGNRTLLFSMESLGIRVNSQVLAIRAREMRLTRLVKIYNCILCVPENYITLKQTLSITLVFTRWDISENDPFASSFFAAFQKKTQMKLIKKLSKYPKQQFTQEHILNLIKIVLCGQELLFSYFLQAKTGYQCSKTQNIMGRQKSAVQGLRSAVILKQGKRLFNLVIELLLKAANGPLRPIEREAILFVGLKFLSVKFEYNEGLFKILVQNFLCQQNPIVNQMSYRIIREQAINYLTVYKVKLLLNLFNVSSWRSLVKAGITEQTVIERLSKINALLMALARRYSDTNLNLKCLPDKYGLVISNVKEVKSLIFVAVFDAIGKLAQPQNLNADILKIQLDKGLYQIQIQFSEQIDALSVQARNQSKQRMAKVMILSSKKEILAQKKQYIRFGEGNYHSLVTVSLGGKQSEKLMISIDGAFYEINLGRKSQIRDFQVGSFHGILQSFYALNIEISPIQVYKQWSEFQRKTHQVVSRLGKDIYCHRLGNREESVIQSMEEKWSFFKAKTQIKIYETIKQPSFVDIFQQLGGLETIFFILERLSRSLLQFQGNGERIVELLRHFFEMLKLTAFLDEGMHFLNEILKCFKYINPFMFLLIKRNRILRQTHDSRLLLSMFEFIMYFRKDKSRSMVPADAQKKMVEIEIQLVVNTLSNFQIWSNCSIPLQQFVLSLIESFIKDAQHIRKLIVADLHKELLSTLILFATSETELSHYNLLQTKIIQLCVLFNTFILKQFRNLADIKQFNIGKSKEKYQTFVERDLFLGLSFLKALSSRALGRHFSVSERSAFEVIAHYILKSYLGESLYFKSIGKGWNLYLSIVCKLVKQAVHMDRELIGLLAEGVLCYMSKQPNADNWLARFMSENVYNSNVSLVDCLHVLHHVAEKYHFLTPGKTSVMEGIAFILDQKVVNVDGQDLLRLVSELEKECQNLPIMGLFRLSYNKQYLKLMELIKHCYFQKNNLDIWRMINFNMLASLLISGRIIQQNSTFVKFLLFNLYEKDDHHPLAFCRNPLSREHTELIRQFSKRQRLVQNKAFGPQINRTVYALMQHCRGWFTLYFLHDQGLLTGIGDISLPFLSNQIPLDASPGGPIVYYLAGKCQLLQLYFLLNIILHRQLGNRISFLATLAPIVIYQKTLQYLTQNMSRLKQFSSLGFTDVVLLLLKQSVNSLNNRYIIKVGTVSKDLERILGSLGTDNSRKKVDEVADALARGSTKIQLALEESTVDKELSTFLEIALNRIKVIPENCQKTEAVNALVSLAEQLKKFNEVVFVKLKIGCFRFFQVSRQYWMLRNVNADQMDPVAEKVSESGVKDLSLIDNFQKLLEQRYQKILLQCTERGIESEKLWQNLLISNEYWFEFQGDIGDLTTRFYELDEKQIGPFGFYKLGIKPVRTDLMQLPYPRRQEYKDLIIKKEEEQRQKNLAPRSTILANMQSTFFSSIAETSKSDLFHRSITSEAGVQKEKKVANSYWCEWITKRGVYAGKLRKTKKGVQFTFTGHAQLPEEREYRMSSNGCHCIEQLSEWEDTQINNAVIPYLGAEIFTRRYILRHTAFEIFNQNTHRSYFFNLFHNKLMMQFLGEFRGEAVEVIVNRAEEFQKKGFTDRWCKGEISNFQYLCLANRYSGRTTNDLGQYMVLPWVMINFDGKYGFRELNKEFMNDPRNMRDLSIPTGKLSQQKFAKLKMRLEQIDPSEKEIRFLYGTMFSNPTVLYNFFIRLQPYTSLHWKHQSGKIDHADRLFSGINEQFATILSSSSDMKELCPQFYYWPQFLKNRNRIELGRKQKGDEVNNVTLPVWAKSPQEFIFKMREVLESPHVSLRLHLWIDLIFGYKAPFDVAEQYDNLYHYQCYQKDIFTAFQTQTEMRTAQIMISEFGQVPETIFYQEHPQRFIRKDISIDYVVNVLRPTKGFVAKGYQFTEAGIMAYSQEGVVFKKAAIGGFYNSFEWTRQFENESRLCSLISVNLNRWITLQPGFVRIYEKKRVRSQYGIQSRCLQCMGDYLFLGVGSKIEILKLVDERLEEVSHLHGHHSQVIVIRTEPLLDLMVSVDRSGLVLVHELIDLRFLRAFHLGTEFEGENGSRLRVLIHRMGYFIFLDHEQTIYVYNYLGEQLVEQEMLIKSEEGRSEDEVITDIQLFSHEQPVVLGSTSRGNIYSFSFIEIMRFRDIYPYKNCGRTIKNLLSAIPKRPSSPILQFSMVRGRGTSNLIYQLLVLYADGELVYFSQSNEMGRQLQENSRLKSMGIV